MSWNVKYAACRYFRRVGATVNKADKLIVFNTPPPRGETCTSKVCAGTHKIRVLLF